MTLVDDRDPHEPPPAVPLETIAQFSAGLVCLSGCADHGVQDEAPLRRLREAFGPERLRVELQRPFQRHDRARNRARAQLARRLPYGDYRMERLLVLNGVDNAAELTRLPRVKIVEP